MIKIRTGGSAFVESQRFEHATPRRPQGLVENEWHGFTESGIYVSMTNLTSRQIDRMLKGFRRLYNASLD